jgi:hypothetical protein
MAMAHYLARGLCFAALAAALTLQGCGKSSSVSSDRPVHPVAARGAVADPPASPPAASRGATISERSISPAPGAFAPEKYQTGDPQPWLAELLHAPDPNVRIQGLDAWARQPGVSLDPVTYALVDPDESVRARAREVLEQVLARR